ncbi:hypothetical protein [Streptomyces sp. NPDC005805]|uniref:hypothetical protein n=1 Tax=Streptomyces sp. NPDC005805 TaxID=3157068 RepID=UPI003404BDEF
MSQALLAGLSRTTEPFTALRRVLALDAVVTAAGGLVCAVLPGPVGRLLGMDAGLLLGLGIFLAVYGSALGLLASRAEPPALPVRLAVETNLLWSVLSVAAVVLWLEPTTAGAVWIPAQALVSAAFAAAFFTAHRATAAVRR